MRGNELFVVYIEDIGCQHDLKRKNGEGGRQWSKKGRQWRPFQTLPQGRNVSASTARVPPSTHLTARRRRWSHPSVFRLRAWTMAPQWSTAMPWGLSCHSVLANR